METALLTILDVVRDWTSWLIEKGIPALIILIVGFLVGRIGGKYIAKFLDKVGLDDLIEKTVLGDIIKKSGYTVVQVIEILIRWFIYLIFIVWAVDVLAVEALTEVVSTIWAFIPRLIAAVVIGLVGIIAIDFFSDTLTKISEERKIEGGVILSTVLRYFLYLILVVLVLDQLKIETLILKDVIDNLILGLAIGVGAGVAGFLTISAWASREEISSLASGLIQKGDGIISEGSKVRIDDLEGTVVRVGRAHTVLETEKGERIAIPNRELSKKRITVFQG
ncbi:hypothetical protein DRN46_01785 [Thermococci archaeon]|nr:MAG: hypothetical protein DRN46_01785 [Thermococci archaeon]